MNKITKTQRDQLIIVGIVTVVVMACLWYFVEQAAENQLKATQANSRKMADKLKGASDKIKSADAVSLALTNAQENLKALEAGFAPEHEPYSWMVGIIGHFYLPPEDVHRYKSVSDIDFTKPEITDKGIIGNFPYKWARFHITGKGHYHDLGKFIADFENNFRYFQIENIDITVPTVHTDQDLLAFSFDIVAPQVAEIK
jgi:Tfp pilus assembly protein PilO